MPSQSVVMDAQALQGALSMAGRSVIVTGGTRGIGRHIAEAFLLAGASVTVCGRRAPEDVPQAGGRSARFIAADVRGAQACHDLVDAVLEAEGRLDVVVNNAGGSPAAEAATVSPRFSEAIIALNLTAPLHMSQAAYAALHAARGVIVNIASVAGQRASPGTAAYGAAKAGLLSLTRSLAQEWAPQIRVNAIIAGLMETEDTAATYGSAAAQAALCAALPGKRMGQGADIAAACLFLASPLAPYVNGAELAVHGGGEPPLFMDILRRFAAEK